MPGNVSYAARPDTAVFSSCIRIADNDADLIDRNAHFLRYELPQDRMGARTLIDGWTQYRKSSVGFGREDNPGVAAADMTRGKRDAAPDPAGLRLFPVRRVQRR